jgi:hypothetical protein
MKQSKRDIEDTCERCGNDGSDRITCERCERQPGEVSYKVLRRVLDGDEGSEGDKERVSFAALRVTTWGRASPRCLSYEGRRLAPGTRAFDRSWDRLRKL